MLRIAIIVVGSVVWFGTVLSSLSFAHNVRVWLDKDAYRAETFVVSDVFFEAHVLAERSLTKQTAGNMGACYLIGTIRGKEENLAPAALLSGDVSCSKSALESAYPRETSLAVWFNENAPDLRLQGKTLRVIEGKSYFDDLGESIRNYIVFGLVPSLLLIAALVWVKRLGKQARR